MRTFARTFAGNRKAIVAAAIVIGTLGTATAIAADTATSTEATATSTISIADANSIASTTNFTAPIESASTTITASSSISSIATTTPKDPLTCTSAYVADLYNTPSGHLDSGYTLNASSSGILAIRIGSQAWTDCHDRSGHTYEFKISQQQYAALSQPDAVMPMELPDASAELGIATSSPVSLPAQPVKTQSQASVEQSTTDNVDQTATSSDEVATSTEDSVSIATSSAATSTPAQSPTPASATSTDATSTDQ